MAIQNLHLAQIFRILVLLNIGNYAFCMQFLTCVNQRPELTRYSPHVFDISNPQNLFARMRDGWEKQVDSRLIKYNPMENLIKKLALQQGAEQYSLIFAKGRASRPAAQTQPRDFGAINRHRATRLSSLSSDELELVRNSLVPRGAVVLRDGEYHWAFGTMPDDRCGLSQSEMNVLRNMWGKFGPEANPIQTNYAYENQVVACLIAERSKQSFCLLPNIFPIYPMHYLMVSTIPDKPQCIADERELFDLLNLQGYLAQQEGHAQINFNSNNAGHTMGGASLSVWHCQIADLGLGDPSTLKAEPIMEIGDVSVGIYKHLKTSHRLFMGKNQAEVSHVAFAYISVLHNANNAYNISLFKDADGNFRVLLTIRGCWLAKSSKLVPQHNGTPAFAEVAGSLIFTNSDEYNSVVGQEPQAIEEFVKNLQGACSQDSETVAQFDQSFRNLFPKP